MSHFRLAVVLRVLKEEEEELVLHYTQAKTCGRRGEILLPTMTGKVSWRSHRHPNRFLDFDSKAVEETHALL